MKRTAELDTLMRGLTCAGSELNEHINDALLKIHQCNEAQEAGTILYELPHKDFAWVEVWRLAHSLQRVVSPFISFCPFCGTQLNSLRALHE